MSRRGVMAPASRRVTAVHVAERGGGRWPLMAIGSASRQLDARVSVYDATSYELVRLEDVPRSALVAIEAELRADMLRQGDALLGASPELRRMCRDTGMTLAEAIELSESAQRAATHGESGPCRTCGDQEVRTAYGLPIACPTCHPEAWTRPVLVTAENTAVAS